MAKKFNRARQMATIDYMIAHPNLTRKKLCDQLNLPIATLHYWLLEPDFVEMYEERIKSEWEVAIKEAQANMIRLMHDEDNNISYKATKYVLDSAGFAPKTVVEGELCTDIYVTIDNENK